MLRPSRLMSAVFGAGLMLVCVTSGAHAQWGTWSGAYWGVNAGATWATATDVRRASDVAWGGHFGYGLQFSALYFGAEVDGTWGGARVSTDLSSTLTSSLEVDWTAT